MANIGPCRGPAPGSIPGQGVEQKVGLEEYKSKKKDEN
jgi:hypothetical protein